MNFQKSKQLYLQPNIIYYKQEKFDNKSVDEDSSILL